MGTRSEKQTVPDTERLVAGVMSGTSADGVDVALVRLRGSGSSLAWSVERFESTPYPEPLRRRVLEMGEADAVLLNDVALMNVRLAAVYADAVRSCLPSDGRLDLVGCHGQTVRHLPDPVPFEGADVAATLQLGSGPTLANLLGVPVVSDFRAADMALGGQGAPLVPYADRVLLGDAEEHRIALNIGGIANLTYLPAARSPVALSAFDTGPGNMLCDALSTRLLDRPFDDGGVVALRGEPSDDLIRGLLADPWFEREPPKSTGREAFGAGFVQDYLDRCEALGLSVEDRLATAACFTADSVVEGIRRWVTAPESLDRVIVSGGGVRNRAIMQRLESRLDPVPVQRSDAFGLDADAKESVAFAVLAHEAVNGVPTGMPSVTGARRPAVQGSLSFPA